MPTPNTPELVAIYQHIEAHPDEHDQGSYAVQGACGTKYCFAWTAVIRAGYQLNWVRREWDEGVLRAWGIADSEKWGHGRGIYNCASELLGLDLNQADRLFLLCDDLDDLRKAIGDITGVDPATADLATLDVTS